MSDEEVTLRRARYGPNTITEGDKQSFLSKLWEQINSSLIWILVVCAVVSAALREWADLVLILAVIFLNVTIGLVQEVCA